MTQTKTTERRLSEWSIGTKAHASIGGFWTRTDGGWKWCCGDTFPTPGGDVIRWELPS